MSEASNPVAALAATAADTATSAPFRGPRIVWQLGVWLLVAALLPFGIAMWLISQDFAEAIRQQTRERLQSVADRNATQIDTYVAGLLADTSLLASAPAVINTLSDPSPANLLVFADRHRAYMERLITEKGINDLLLLDATGKVVYAFNALRLRDRSLDEANLETSELPATIRSANTLMQSEISNFGWVVPLGKELAFAVAPVFANGKIVGNLVLLVDNATLFRVVNNYTGLSNSGEIVVAFNRRDGQLGVAAPSRMDSSLNQKRFGANHGLGPIEAALRGQEGSGTFLDYRGKDVMAAWKYLPSLNWGLVAKVDQDEVFAPVDRFRKAVAGLVLLALAVVGVALWVTFQQISRPITRLSRQVAGLDEHTLDFKVQTTARNEIATLVAAFNRLINRLRSHQTELEDKVRERTDALLASRANLQQAQRIARLASWECQPGSRVLTWSDELSNLIGPPAHTPPTLDNVLAIIHPEEREQLRAVLLDFVADGKPFDVDHRVIGREGPVRWVRHLGRQGSDGLLHGAVLDMTDLRQAQSKVDEYLRIVNENVITSTLSPEGRILAVSDAFCRISGYSREELVGMDSWALLHPETPLNNLHQIARARAEGRVWEGEALYQTKDGGQFWVREIVSPSSADGKGVTGFTAVHQDISDRKRVEQLSLTDELTGLNNRRAFNLTAPRELQRTRRDGKGVALMMIDVDFFKRYNDRYGHLAGDDALVRVADRLRELAQRGGDFVFRMGGEEFAVLLHVASADLAGQFGGMLVRGVAGLNIDHADSPIATHVTVSVGVAFVDAQVNATIEDLYREADHALYLVKESTRNNVRTATLK